ncbi:MAG: hypothetical protein COU46_02625 [Candidatus Niyogibacteria bacterium CG10_big_fil_rev_8_21_14_0_10_42_19]|uniref:Transglycosylase SLT domain-containing protein n=1 Tax=Candidatus Niyogibacteria bacterium CG10_big_fil_rev_8_21_14_0_10_42_19 TaxID=1974725 RepID=A0A2H0THB9_9BACT|nr:MAG: hypothetical protein COU46_02625 [Candidatus Niyogibacteria bacterium CG10_big_fil_rev_8_21_14_0_10_42_19]
MYFKNKHLLLLQIPIALMFFLCATEAPAFSVQSSHLHKKNIVPEKKVQASLDDLIKKLSPAFHDNYAKTILSDDRLTLDYSILPAKLTPEQIKKAGNFKKRILSADAVAHSKRYMEKFKNDFDAAHRKYGVPPEIIASIIRIETHGGSYLGRRSVINSLFSSYVLRPSRRNFALSQLEYFLKITHENFWDPYSIMGSDEGAFGIPQFIPWSFTKFAVDGSGDGFIDLFNHADAIASVANYLQKNGWSKYPKKKRSAILRYNRWSTYADLVLEFAELLKKNNTKKELT